MTDTEKLMPCPFKTVDVVGKGYEGYVNLFFDEYPVALVPAYVAAEIKTFIEGYNTRADTVQSIQGDEVGDEGMTPEVQWSIREKSLLDKIEHLEKQVYVPGVTRCAKCGFQLISSTMCAESGKFSANNAPQQCANGCGPMWKVTERDAGNRLCDRMEPIQIELTATKAAAGEVVLLLEKAEKYLREINVYVPELKKAPTNEK